MLGVSGDAESVKPKIIQCTIVHSKTNRNPQLFLNFYQ